MVTVFKFVPLVHNVKRKVKLPWKAEKNNKECNFINKCSHLIFFNSKTVHKANKLFKFMKEYEKFQNDDLLSYMFTSIIEFY